MPRPVVSAVVALLAATALVAADHAGAKYVSSGVIGNTYVTGCPGAAPPGGEHCTSPYQATIRVLTDCEDRKLVKTFRTRSDGSFKVHLRPGRYILDPQPGDPDSRATAVKRHRVTVKKKRFVYVQIYFDGGLR
jgi:hypothetical protein